MRGEPPTRVSAAVIDRLRTVVPGPGPDRYLALDIAAAVHLVVTGALLESSGLPEIERGRDRRMESS
jgi:histidine ammonia-lyase